jgi:hypothetical protein
VAQDPQDGINEMPRQLRVLRILGFGALLAFPLVTAILITTSPYLLLLMPSSFVLLGFILLVQHVKPGPGFRIAGGVFRGALSRSPSNGLRLVVQILFYGEHWPVICLLTLFGYR